MRIVKRVKYINHYRDRHGRQRYYFRRPGQPQVALPGAPGTPEFETAYRLALADLRISEIGQNRSAVGSVSAAIAGYYGHNSFTALGKSTQQARRAVLEKFRGQHGDKRLATLTREHLAAILGKLQPFAAHNWLKTLRGLMRFAVATGLRSEDPTEGIERAKAKPGSIHDWTEAEIARYQAYWPVGSMPRLALALPLYTVQRGSDVIRIGKQHIRPGNKLYVKQQKTGTELLLPIHPELQRIIEATPGGDLTFLVTATGIPFRARTGFSNSFRTWCDEAGLPAECSAHGLRKSACRRLAELGCSAMEIAAWSGHLTLAEVERYVKAANQAKMAEAGMTKTLAAQHADAEGRRRHLPSSEARRRRSRGLAAKAHTLAADTVRIDKLNPALFQRSHHREE
jgi:integrase